MSTAASPLGSVAGITPAPAAPKETEGQKIKAGFVHVLEFVKKDYQVVLNDVIAYTPKAESLAATLFPESAALDKVAGDKVVQVASLLKNTVLTVEQKYSDAAVNDTTNAQKLGDALAIAGPASLSLLASAGVTADTTRISNAIGAVVAILKTSPAPASS